MRVAALMSDNVDISDLQSKVDKVVELTKTSAERAVVALHDCEHDLNRAVTLILEGELDEHDDEWKEVSSKKKDKEKKKDKDVKQNGEVRGRGGSRVPRGRGGNAAVAKDGQKPRKPQDGPKPGSEDQENGAKKREGQRAQRGAPAGRGRGAPRGRGGRGGGTGGRTFRPSNAAAGAGATAGSEFPNSIDTWTNSTLDGKPAPPAAAPLTVGNWSDVVSADDHWSEEDYDTKLMETKVFHSSVKGQETLDPVPEVVQPAQPPAQPERRLDMASILKGATQQAPVPDVPQQKFSAALQNRNVGAALLQQLQQPNAQPPAQQQPAAAQPSYSQPSQTTYLGQQVNSDTLKSMVGIGGSGTYAGQAAQAVDTQKRPPVPQPMQQRRQNKIPDQPVEMPTYDHSVSTLHVQFGALDMHNQAEAFAAHLTQQDQPKPTANYEKPAAGTSDPAQLRTRSPLHPYRAATAEQAKAGNDLLKSIGHQGLDKQGATYGKTGLDQKPDVYAPISGQDALNYGKVRL